MSIKTINVISIIFAVVSLVLVICACWAPILFTNVAYWAGFFSSETGQIGDTIGGTMGPFVSIAGVFMTFIAFLMQVNANKIQSTQLKKSFSLKLLEDKIDSRKALQLLSIDIKVQLKEIDLVCQEIDSFCADTEKRPVGDVPLHFTPQKSHCRYQTINRNHVYNGFTSFVESQDILEDFRKTYSLMDFYAEGIVELYSNTYKPYTEDIVVCKNQIRDAFNNLIKEINDSSVYEETAFKNSVDDFNKIVCKSIVKEGILDIYELYKILDDKSFSLIYQVAENTYLTVSDLIKRLITLNLMLVNSLKEASREFKKTTHYDALVNLRGKIDTALSVHTIEIIQHEFEEKVY